MMHLTFEDIQESERKFRINLINSITGIKPANLIGSISTDGINNLAIISSVVHLGSHPPFIGFVMRPKHEVKRDTYENLASTGHFTINQVPAKLVENAHYTSAKFEAAVSEFEACKIQEIFLGDFPAPFVKESPIKIGLSLQETIPIKSNNTLLIVGKVEQLYIDDQYLDERGYVHLDKMNVAGIGGLNSYYTLNKITDFPYARVEENPF
jgi:flavin reductase (DIM6/NTAB) family NADH-FMN oxidoreductase RutF